jgi:beta-fructofuranosidase
VYTPRGFGQSEVGDIEIFPHGDELHLFHLTLPNHDAVQHVVSTDGLTWHPLPDALRTSNHGACDDDQIWTMSVSEHDGTFHMLYTALSRAEDGMIQRTAHASSPDLLTWTKDARNPVAQADPRWYEFDLTTPNSVSWRDPKPVLVDGVWHAAVNARENHGPVMRRGCVGHFTSTDFETWEVHPPLFAPGRFWDLECPQVFTVDGAWYLTAGIMEERSQRYWIGDSPLGPWRQPPRGGILAPQGHYAGRVAHWKGQDIYMSWHLPHGGTADWAPTRNPHGKYVVAPLALTRRADGSLACASFDGWNALADAPSAPLPAPAASLFRQAPSDGWRLENAPGALDLLAGPEEYGDYRLTGTLTLDAPTGGIGFRLTGDSGGGYFIQLDEGLDRVSLQKWLPRTISWTAHPGFGWQQLQAGRLRQAFTPGTPLALQLIVNGPYIEVALESEVVIAALSGERATGQLGIWAESGSVALTDPVLTPLHRPRHG